jgi:hypothetical protein
MQIRPTILATLLVLTGYIEQSRGQTPSAGTTQAHCPDECGADRPACEIAWGPRVSVVFAGRVTNIREQSVPILLDGQQAHTPRQTVTFSIDEALKGIDDKTAVVISGGDLCGFPFYSGKKYLVYADRTEDGRSLRVTLCNGTKWLNEASDDLAYLRTISTRPSTGFLYGTVFRDENESARARARVPMVRLLRPVKGQRVQVRGRQNYTAEVNSEGAFRLDDLEPGTYEVSLEMPEPALPGSSRLVRVPSKGCAVANFHIQPVARRVLSH